ncbi:ATP-dependent DNA/RNA helicase DHX36-like [Argopecten irradians]|uniref:ATP-dependent DNA/RNA helicase DHX36-like n=1 Tax=Argopecten irradians TaxID=31199 RepID=UPI0037244C94
MFGGEIEASEEMVDDELRPKVTVDEWILFWTSLSTAQMVKDLRQQLDKILEEKIKHPGPTDWSKSSREGAIMSAITELLTTEILVNYKGENIQTQRKEKYHGFKW